VFEKIYTAAQTGIEEGSPVKRAVAHWALGVGRAARERERAGRSPNPLDRVQLELADRAVLSKVRALFGSRLKLALTGAAPIARDVLEFFDSCGVLVLEGYGMTETTAAATLNTEHGFRFGSVGRPLRDCTIDVAVDGEILIGGPNVFLGYFKNEDATRDTIDPMGRVRSGDLGSVDEDGFTFITGRKKDLIITSSGKNITPSNIENHLRESRWISQAVTFGDNRPYIVAALTLDPDEAPALAAKLGIEPDIEAMAEHPLVRAELQKAVDDVNEQFARIEQVKRFTVLARDLTLADGELTPTLKVKRQVVYKRYADVFAALYEG
jgi:long-chain acyl-CoA synthetase